VVGPLLFRAGVTLIVGLVAGGTALLRHPLFLAFLGLEVMFSLVEGLCSRAGVTGRVKPGDLDPAQVPFVLAGKWYLLARTVYQVIVLLGFSWIARTTPVLPSALSALGASLIVAGIVLRGWSMTTLGDRFRGWDVRREAGGLETRGPYAIIRHPSYLGLALFDIGMPLLLGVPQFLALVIAPLLLLLRRVMLEEQLLMRAYDDYAAYAARTGRLLPSADALRKFEWISRI
jgi:protein-S-isoprenylcysteine O-methyltransferase Ste14